MRVTHKSQLVIALLALMAGGLPAAEKDKKECCSIDLSNFLGAARDASTLAGQRVVEGNSESAVRVIIYEDLQCPDCAAFRRMLDQHLLPKYGDRVAFEHRDFPLPKHSWARNAAVAARYFGSIRPDLGTEYRRYAMAALREMTAENFNDKLAAFATSHGVEPTRALEALGDASFAEMVEKEFQEGEARGVRRTPTVFVAEHRLEERFSLEEMKRVLDEALKKAER